MPAYCTHYIFACELLPALTELAGFDLNRDAVMLGTQGPDVFITPWTGSAIPLCTPSSRSWRTAAAPCTNPPCIIL